MRGTIADRIGQDGAILQPLGFENLELLGQRLESDERSDVAVQQRLVKFGIPDSLAPMLTTAVRLVGVSNSKSLSSAIAQILSSP
jgi:hypothetical protein